MRRMLLALLCAAPLVSGLPAEVPQTDARPETPAPVELVYLASMGCDLADCADPTHCHYCPAGCTDPTHYHTCPVGCTDPTHPHCGQCWEVAEEATQVPAPEFWNSMGCWRTDCADPTHYHHCPAGCTDPAHYHDCPLGCQAHDHGCGYTGGHHGGHGGHHGRWHN